MSVLTLPAELQRVLQLRRRPAQADRDLLVQQRDQLGEHGRFQLARLRVGHPDRQLGHRRHPGRQRRRALERAMQHTVSCACGSVARERVVGGGVGGRLAHGGGRAGKAKRGCVEAHTDLTVCCRVPRRYQLSFTTVNDASKTITSKWVSRVLRGKMGRFHAKPPLRRQGR